MSKRLAALKSDINAAHIKQQTELEARRSNLLQQSENVVTVS